MVAREERRVGQLENSGNLPTGEDLSFTFGPHLGNPRSEIFRIAAEIGCLSSKILLYAPLDCEKESKFWTTDSKGKDEITLFMGKILLSLVQLSQTCKLDLYTCIIKKMHLNGKKYPVELCKGKAGKYTSYSKETGITKTSGQSTMTSEFSLTADDMDQVQSIQEITMKIRKFASERDWEKHHSPRNIALAMIGELGELAELFQWNGDVTCTGDMPDISEEEKDHIGQELADVCIYLIRLADVCNIDLGKAALTA